MKNFIVVLTLGLLATINASSQKSVGGDKPIRIAFVDTDAMLKQLPEAIEADKKLRELGMKFQDTLKTMSQQLTERVERYQKQSSMMNAESKSQEENALKAMQQNMYAYQEEKLGNNGELAKRQADLIAPLREKIQKGIAEVAKIEGFAFVFDKANPSLLYAEDKFDITFTVLDRIKRGAK